MVLLVCVVLDRAGRSREGAWIEMLDGLTPFHRSKSRSREGAWIEISAFTCPTTTLCERRSREGAWIEIHKSS